MMPSQAMKSLSKGVRKVVHARRTADLHWKSNEMGTDIILELEESASEELSPNDDTHGLNFVKKKKKTTVKTFGLPLVEGAHHAVGHGGLNIDY
jgi:hypothetical protein